MNEGERGVEEAISELREKIAELSDFADIYSVIARDSIIFNLDSKGNFTSVKKGEMLLRSFNGKPFLSVVSREDRKNAADMFMKCLSGEKIYASIKAEGKEFNVTAIPVRKGGKIGGVQGMAREVAARNDFGKLLDVVDNPMCISDLLGNISAANSECTSLFGCEEMKGKNIFDFIDESYAAGVREQARKAMEGIYKKNEVYVVTGKGIKIPVEIYVRGINNEDELLFSIRETTGKKAMEREAEEAAGRMDRSFQQFREKLSAVSNAGNKTSIQELYDEAVNIMLEFFGADHCIIAVPSDGNIAIAAGGGGLIDEVFEEGEIKEALESSPEIREGRYEAHGEKGGKMYVPLSYYGNVVGVLGVAGMSSTFSDDDLLVINILSRDIAKSVLYLENKESLGRYMETLNNAVEGIYRTTFDGKILEANPAFLKLFGYEGRKEELKGINAEQLFLKPEDRKNFLEALEKNGTVSRFETRYVTRDKKIIFGRESAWVVPYGDGRAIEGIFHDISHEKELEEDARFYNSLLRHDIYNKNEIAIGYLGLLKNSDMAEKDMEMVKKAVAAITEGNGLIETVKKLETIREKRELKNINLDDVMERIVEHYSEEARKRDIKITYIPSGAVVRGNGLIEDVFSNLVKNAIEHSYGQNVTIYSEDDGEGWKIYVEDDGVGLSNGSKDKIFQQGWKGRGSRGSGLGLYLVKKIVEGFDGKISVKSGEDEFPEGCRFIVWLKKGKNSVSNSRRSEVIGHESESPIVRW